jgi:enterochelin esterase-like enzyme
VRTVLGMADDASDLDWVVDDLQVESSLLGEPWRLVIQRPTDLSMARELTWLWMLHGRNGSIEEMRPLLASVAAAIRDRDLPPLVVVVPDAPDDHRTSWWVDSALEPADGSEIPFGRRLETSLLDEVLPFVERRYGGPASASQRIIGGISMGGGAALRWLLVRPDLFRSALLLSPAVFERLPAHGSAARRRDVMDVESSIFDTAEYGRLLHYPTLLAAIEPDREPSRVVVIVGDDEPIRNDPIDRRDLELEAARLHTALKIHPAYESSLRVVGGGHDWPVWELAIVTGLQILIG